MAMEGDGMKEIKLTAPEGWEFDGEPEFNEGNIHPGWYIPLRRAQPAMVAMLLTRRMAEHLQNCALEGHHEVTDGLGQAAKDALARDAVVIAGPHGCAEVSVEQASDARCALTAHSIDRPTSAFAAGVKAVETALDKALGHE
jgi:hypothetical protein